MNNFVCIVLWLAIICRFILLKIQVMQQSRGILIIFINDYRHHQNGIRNWSWNFLNMFLRNFKTHTQILSFFFFCFKLLNGTNWNKPAAIKIKRFDNKSNEISFLRRRLNQTTMHSSHINFQTFSIYVQNFTLSL